MAKDILSLMESKYESFSKGQRRITKYIEDNFDKAAFMTAARLGKAVGVSESTVVRFASELGFEGYPDMRKALQEMIRNRLTSVQRIEVARETMGEGDAPLAILYDDMDKLRMTMEELDREGFRVAVDKILHANHIYIIGARSSAALSVFMGFYFNLLFENVKVVNDTAVSEIFEQILRVSPEDVMIAISFPRYSRRTVKAAQYAKDMGATVIGITDIDTSPVARIADISLYAKSDMVSFLDSLVAPMSLINALIVAAGTETNERLSGTFERLEHIWDEYEVYEKTDE